MENLNQTKPLLLTDSIESFLKSLKAHNSMTKGQMVYYEHSLNSYLEALSMHNVDISTLKFTAVDEHVVEYIHHYALEIKKFSNSTYNRYFSALKTFTDFTISAHHLNYNSPFSNIFKRRHYE